MDEIGDLFGGTATVIPWYEIGGRLVLATAIGAALGWERERLARPAGLRTHMMVALAAALFTVITFELFYAVITSDARREVEATSVDARRGSARDDR